MMLERLQVVEAQDLMRYCLESGRVIPSKHFRDELANESVSMVDAWSVLQSGRIYNSPEFHVGSQEWNYRVEGYEPGGKWTSRFLAGGAGYICGKATREATRKARALR